MDSAYSKLIRETSNNMYRRATLEILQGGEIIFGSPIAGKYFVQEFENERPRGGAFFKTIKEAEKHMIEYEKGDL
jgi:hypothetical protein